MSSSPTCYFCLLWHLHTIFGTWVYNHERMCQVHSWSWYDIDLWPQGKIYRVYDMALCSGLSFFVIVILCLACECITLIWCVTYLHELCMTLTFDLNIKITFSLWIWVWQDIFALWHRHTKFWHMSESPRDNMLCTFLTLVGPWPLTYMLVAEVSLVSFTHSFYLVFSIWTRIFYCKSYSLSHHILCKINVSFKNFKSWAYAIVLKESYRKWKKTNYSTESTEKKTHFVVFCCSKIIQIWFLSAS